MADGRDVIQRFANPCVYAHGDCTDGVTAAWIARRRWPSCQVEFAQYGAPLPEPAVMADSLLFLDYCPDRAFLTREERPWRVLDHHATAAQNCGDVHGVYVDQNRSGAGIAWDVLIGGARPWIVDYVEDGDLFRFALPESRAVRAVLQSTSLTVDAYDALSREPLPDVIRDGHAMNRLVLNYCEFMAKTARTGTWMGKRVAFVAAPKVMISEALDTITKRTGVDIAIGFRVEKNGTWTYSLRGAGSREMAETMGGGGHPNAAGFTLPEFVDLLSLTK